jgi:hypothetical protein
MSSASGADHGQPGTLLPDLAALAVVWSMYLGRAREKETHTKIVGMNRTAWRGLATAQMFR